MTHRFRSEGLLSGRSEVDCATVSDSGEADSSLTLRSCGARSRSGRRLTVGLFVFLRFTRGFARHRDSSESCVEQSLHVSGEALPRAAMKYGDY